MDDLNLLWALLGLALAALLGLLYWRAVSYTHLNMVNKSRGEMAYTLVDVDSAVGPDALHTLAEIAGVLAVRYLPQTT